MRRPRSCFHAVVVFDVVIVAVVDVIGIVDVVDVMDVKVFFGAIAIDIFVEVDAFVSFPIVDDRHYTRPVPRRHDFSNLSAKPMFSFIAYPQWPFIDLVKSFSLRRYFVLLASRRFIDIVQVFPSACFEKVHKPLCRSFAVHHCGRSSMRSVLQCVLGTFSQDFSLSFTML